MIEKIAGLWLLFCVGNLLADAGIAFFAFILYKISKISSEYSHALIKEAGEIAEAAVSTGPPEPSPERDDVPPRGYSEPIEPWTPPTFRPPPRPQELSLWEGRQKYPLILFGIGIAIQIIALIFSI